MTPKERVIAQIEHKETDFIPYTLDFEMDYDKSLYQDVLEGVNSYYGDDSWRSKLDNHLVRVQTTNYGFVHNPGKAIVSDIFNTRWRVDKRPMQVEKPALEMPTLKGYEFPDLDAFFNEGWYENALQFINEKRDHFLITALGFGLFERSWAIRGFENALVDSAAYPDFYQELIERIFEQQMMILEKVLPLPIDGFLFSDDWTHQDGVMIGIERWRKYFKPYMAKMYAKVHEAGKYTLNHMCGAAQEVLPDLIEIGLDVYESVQPEAKGNSPYRLKKLYGKDLAFWGGLGSQSIIPFGTPAEMKAEIRKLCKEMGKEGGYILAPAKPLQPGTPIENAVAIIGAFAEEAGICI